MSFVRFIEPNAVTFNKEGNPNSFGRVTFCEIGTTTKKDIWNDSALTISVENPLYFDAGGRLEKDVYLEVGDYTVYYEKFEGSGDPKIAPDTDFSSIYNADVAGKPEPAQTNGSKLQVNTIAELRLIDVPSEPVDVLYYNTLGDCYSRTYYWDPTSTESDNYGSIIKATNQFTGRYKTKFSDVIDVRAFGIFTGTDTTKNSQLNALISFVNSSTEVHTIYFPTGTYHFAGATFTFTNKIILDKDVKFSTTGTLNININSDFDIQGNNPLISGSGVNILFNRTASSNNTTIKSIWYGTGGDSINGDSAIITAICANDNFDVEVSNTLYHKTGTCVFNDDVNFISGGGFILQGGTLTFSGSKLTNVSSSQPFNITLAGNWNSLRFTNDAEVRSSCFVGASDAWQTILTGIQTFSSKSTFIIDSNLAFSGSWTDNGTLIYKHRSGYITTSVSEQYATFESFEAADSVLIFNGNNAYVGIKNQPVKATWFMSTNPSVSEETRAIKNGFRSACMGSGQFDLCGLTYEVTDGFDVINTAIQNIRMYNGNISNTAASILIDFKTPISTLTFDDVFYFATFGYNNFLNVNSCEITNVTCNRFISYVSSSAITFSNSNGGSVVWFSYLNGYHRGGPLLSNPDFSQVNMIDNYYINGFVLADKSKSVVQGNYFESCDTVRIRPASAALITGNRFYETDLLVVDNSGILDPIITGNQFESTNTKYSKVRLVGGTAGTRFASGNITGNSFTGNLSASVIMIVAEGSFSGMHRINISDNSGIPEQNIFVPQTNDQSRLNITMTGGSAIGKIYLNDNNKIMFFVPDAMTAPSYMNIIGFGGMYYLWDGNTKIDAGGEYIEVGFANNAGFDQVVNYPAAWKIY